MSSRDALPDLLKGALDDLEQAYAKEGVGRGAMPTLDLWANLLRALDRDGVERRRLPTLLRLSSRAVRTRAAKAVRHEWAECAGSGPTANVRLTERGVRAANSWPLLEASAEARWRLEAGEQRVDRVRAALQCVVEALPLEHPHYPASYGPADASVTGGYGRDWKAVSRVAGSSAQGLPLSALISQVMMAFALDYERISAVSLSLSMSVLRRVGDGRCALGHREDRAGLSSLVRHGWVRLSRSGGREMAELTVKGHAEWLTIDERVRQVEEQWQRVFGESILRLRSRLEELYAGWSGADEEGGRHWVD